MIDKVKKKIEELLQKQNLQKKEILKRRKDVKI
jgi:hypothetical protein